MSTIKMKQDMKMVRLDDEVHADLTQIGSKNESYSDVIKRLIKFYRDNRGSPNK